MKKNYLSLVITLCFFLIMIPLSAREMLSAKTPINNNQIGERHWDIEADKGILTSLAPFMRNLGTTGDEVLFYEGYAINYEKQEGQLHLSIISNALEGIIEIAPGKYSPAMKLSTASTILPALNGDPVTVSIDGYGEVTFQWYDPENTPQANLK